LTSEGLTDFDFKNSFYYVNLGEANHQCWEDSEIGILSDGNV